MKFQIVEKRNQWDEFVSGQEHSQFLQSWSWGEFQKALGRRVWRVGLFENDEMVGAAQIIEHYLGLGMGYLYCPRGPVFSLSFRAERGIPTVEELRISELISFLEKAVPSYGELFLRIEPLQKFVVHSSEFGVQRAASVQPSHVLLLDLSQSEETLLVAMHPKTRYNIRLAEKKGLEFQAEESSMSFPRKRESSSTASQPKDLDSRFRGNDKYRKYSPVFDAFWSLLQETARRDKIRLHPKKYYEMMLQNVTCYPSSEAGLLRRTGMLHVTYFKNLLAAGFFIGFGDTFAYVHGASSRQHRELMASYLLHWQAIKFAKASGYRYYDFGGVNPESSQDFDYRPSWEGITRFKKGFASGHIISYPGTFDVVLNKWGYRIYQSARKINYLIRHSPL